MPNYRGPFGHRNQTIVLAALSLGIPILTQNLWDLLVTCGILAGLKLSPDLDLNPNAFGIIGRIGFANEYAELIPHRSLISHTPVLSTALRFSLFVSVPVLLVGGIFGLWPPWWAILRVFGGLCLADCLHVATDCLFTYFKIRRRYGRKRGIRRFDL
jgi:uncharacterized metal-binding protein